LAPRQQLALGQVDVSLLRRLPQHMAQGGHGAVERVGGNAQLGRDLVGGLEADAAYIARQPVGRLAHHPHRLVAVLAVDAQAEGRGHVVRREEEHHLLNGLLLLPGGPDGPRAHRPDARRLLQPLGLLLNHRERLEAEVAHQPVGRDGAHTADQAGAEVLADAFDGGRQHDRVVLDLELAAVLRVRGPAPAQAQVLADVDGGQRPDHGD